MPIKSFYPDLPELPQINVHHVLLRRPDQTEWPDFPVHVDAETGKTRSFRDFVERVEWAATALGATVEKGGLELSAENGDMIGIMSENCMDYITFAHACWYIATPFALISSYSKPFELKHALTLAKVTCLFIDEKFLSMALPIAEKIGLPSKKIFVMTGHASGRRSFSQLIGEARARKVEIVNVQPAQKDTLSHLIFSSGTTGLPKAVMISHGNLLATIAQSAVVDQAMPESARPPVATSPEAIPKSLAFLPLHHAYGFMVFCVRDMLMPKITVIMPKWNIDQALSLIPKYRINYLPLIPSVVHQLVHYPKTAKADLSSLLSLACGAAYLPPELAQNLFSLTSKQLSFTEGYGMSESTLAVISSPKAGSLGDRLNPKRGSTGVLLAGLTARIVRDDRTEAGVNEVGELWVKGATISAGYLNNEKATKETFADGWLRTGDRFWMDEGGHFFFADRAKTI